MSTTTSILLWRSPALQSLRPNTLRSYNYSRFHRLASTSTSSPSADNHEKSVVNFAVLNGPKSTLPGPLELPIRTPDATLFGHVLRTGKAYLAFYKDGLKNVWKNFHAARPIRTRQIKQGKGTLTKLVEDHAINRSEFQLLLRSKHDNRRIPFFLILFIVCGEMTPFVVLLMPKSTPMTCWVPKQLEKMRKKTTQQRRQAWSSRPENFPVGPSISPNILSRPQLLHCSNVLGLHSTMWPQNYLPPTFWLRHSLNKHLEYLNLDDELMVRSGGSDGLFTGEELNMAAEQRGIDVLDRSESDIRADLREYFARRKQAAGRIGAEVWFRPLSVATKSISDSTSASSEDVVRRVRKH
ncbi:hypothetical protein BJ508DRAFT_417242 [Ascobolus immersus RN42]|uniref:Letm1 RBD domain-containing protein n=1 Tax=Ascobolus immersus RN42 TaxID=1160509 RepID=A0A3N4HZ69_ASCIM|nr:hypothetical protein BJ508DRAFT_417242 [Ascobolus immersus RN42]